jgi:glycosyltransferase involved in cell wall biosynthesis
MSKNMKKVIITYHKNLSLGAIDNLIDYMRTYQSDFEINLISHPLDLKQIKYSNIQLKDRTYSIKRFPIGIFNYIINFLINFYQLLINSNVDLYIGADNLNTISGLLYKLLFNKKLTVIYFASDFSKTRFNNIFLNKAYELFEKLSIKYSDLIISNTSRSENERIKIGMLSSKSLVIPNGVLAKSNRILNKKFNQYKFIYIGHVDYAHGLLDFLENTTIQIDELTIIGHGEEIKQIETYCKKNKIVLSLLNNLSRSQVLQFLSEFNGFGLAPYKSTDWTYYCSPLKVYEYLVNYVPVIISDVPEVSTLIKNTKLGIVYAHNLEKRNLKAAINSFDNYDFIQNVSKISQDFNLKNLYEKIFKVLYHT